MGKLPAHDPHGERKGLTRSRLVPYAEVLRDDHPQVVMFLEGKAPTQPGRLLADYLAETGGRYEFNMPLGDRLRQQVAALSAFNGDADLAADSQRDFYSISLEHLRGLDPATTRIVVGLRLQYTEQDVKRFNLYDSDPRRVNRVAGQ